MNRLPLPEGTVQVYQSGGPGHGDVDAYLERRYQLPTAHPTAALRAVLERAGYQTFGLHDGQSGDAAWHELTTPTGGDLYVRPAGGSDDAINLRWDGPHLVAALLGGGPA
jgi:hypothetical protein